MAKKLKPEILDKNSGQGEDESGRQSERKNNKMINNYYQEEEEADEEMYSS